MHAANLSSIPLFEGLPAQDLLELRALMTEHRYAPGQIIIREGQAGDTFHVIVQGRVEYTAADATGRELRLEESGEGSSFGELALVTGEKRLVRVKALEPTITLSLRRDPFQDFLLRHPRAAINLLATLGRRLHRTDSLLRQSVVRNVNDVVAERSTAGDRMADRFVAVMGSWKFILIQSGILVLWVTLNILAWANRWDPYPFILLNLALSFQAAYAAPIIMMSQNRAALKDRLAAETDHQVNVQAEVKTSMILSRLEELEKQMRFVRESEERMEERR